MYLCSDITTILKIQISKPGIPFLERCTVYKALFAHAFLVFLSTSGSVFATFGGKFVLSVHIQYSLCMSWFNGLSYFYFPSEDAMEYSKEFVTSVVLGKDLVPRYFLCSISNTDANFTFLQYYYSTVWSLEGSACHNWRVSDATFWKSYRKVTSQRWLKLLVLRPADHLYYKHIKAVVSLQISMNN